ncbi:PWWP domain-containing protein MUM1 [Anabarilius grahami]|uniref:PWWP domain-containing protein MUM1 n=1 Tax=Anabarilius grahami TaxID=495550 RepID=A0A3N0YJW3_ANAGA|nr:PWWP domain-containing protein MUM1 [Anabarilius grahami]
MRGSCTAPALFGSLLLVQCNSLNVDFLVSGIALLIGRDESIINGQKKAKWLDTYSKCSIKKVPVPLFIEDQEQIDVIYTHLTSILDSTPTVTRSDSLWMSFFPESIICALAVVEHVSILEAEEKFLRGPVIDARRDGGRRKCHHTSLVTARYATIDTTDCLVSKLNSETTPHIMWTYKIRDKSRPVLI